MSEQVKVNAYSRFYDEANLRWEKKPEYNHIFLRTQESWFNERLRARGFVFLNEVYDGLGFAPTRDGQKAGWVTGSHVDFGIPKFSEESNSLLLTFNCDDDITDIVFGTEN